VRGTSLHKTDRRAPFTIRIPAHRRPAHGSRRLRARILMRDGRRAVRSVRIRRAPHHPRSQASLRSR
jgi:hypothetical protein